MSELPYNQQSPETIQAMFNGIADSYDRNNQILSLGRYNSWTRKLVKAISPKGGTLLDLCAGTGAVSFEAMKCSNAPKETILLDFSKEMLSIAEARAQEQNLNNLTFLEADAQEIPLPDMSVDAVTQAYGIRNVRDPLACGREVYRVLKHGTYYGILELTNPENLLGKALQSFFRKAFIPTVGRLITSDKNAYRYLAESASRFMTTSELSEQMQSLGFYDRGRIPLMGGVGTILILYKNH